GVGAVRLTPAEQQPRPGVPVADRRTLPVLIGGIRPLRYGGGVLRGSASFYGKSKPASVGARASLPAWAAADVRLTPHPPPPQKGGAGVFASLEAPLPLPARA